MVRRLKQLGTSVRHSDQLQFKPCVDPQKPETSTVKPPFCSSSVVYMFVLTVCCVGHPPQIPESLLHMAVP